MKTAAVPPSSLGHRIVRLGFVGAATVSALAVVTPPARAQTVGQAPALEPLAATVTRSVSTLGPGLDHVELSGRATVGEAPWSAHVLRVDLSRYWIDLALAMDQLIGQETPSSMVERKGALAGVNGGFSVSNDPWNIIHGDPNGFVVIDGEVVSEPVQDRPALGFCGEPGAQEIRVVDPRLRVHVTGPGGSAFGPDVGVVGLNRALAADAHEWVLFTPVWGRTTLTRAGTIEVVVSGGRVTGVTESGSARIPLDGFVLSASGDAGALLRERFGVGERADYTLELTDPAGRTLDVTGCDFTTAGPQVADEGRALGGFDPASYQPGFVVDRHPRTAVGVSADGRTLYLLVIDGRQPDFSAGATLAELAGLLTSEGAAAVYNLDGGGSTAMALDGIGVVNRPSDGTERRRCDVLLIFPVL